MSDLTVGIISGAIMMHLTQIGIEVHNDGGKLMTILVPIYPDVNNSTIFHGNDRFKVDTTDGTMIPWNINEAYMFRSSSHSWHSYVGGESDRFIMNINFFNNFFKR